MTRPVSRLIALVAGPLLAGALAAPVLADARLERTTPEDGAVLDAPPARIVLEFSESLDRGRSSVRLVTGGERVGTGDVTEDDPRTMTIEGLDLGPGEYEVRWTAGSQDGHIIRGRFRFTVLAAATPASTPAPSPAATASASPVASPAVEPSPEPPSEPSPGATPATDGASAAVGTGDVLIPIVVALLFVAGAGVYLLRRSRRSV